MEGFAGNFLPLLAAGKKKKEKGKVQKGSAPPTIASSSLSQCCLHTLLCWSWLLLPAHHKAKAQALGLTEATIRGQAQEEPSISSSSPQPEQLAASGSSQEASSSPWRCLVDLLQGRTFACDSTGFSVTMSQQAWKVSRLLAATTAGQAQQQKEERSCFVLGHHCWVVSTRRGDHEVRRLLLKAKKSSSVLCGWLAPQQRRFLHAIDDVSSTS